ncbi:MAG: translocation protein TolB [Deltaproteobacteria bacterium ADurb.Bin510]|nr:MAG: translocation protein TolB [Deltaproteobacteria bacterium ADurb.Bin510]
MDVNGGGVRRVTFSGRYNTDPVFSPRGDQIAFSYLDPDTRIYRIALIRVDGSDLRVLAGTGRGDTQPAFSPDGRLIAFSCSDGDIYVSDLIGGAAVRVTDGRGAYSEPCWGPLVD